MNLIKTSQLSIVEFMDYVTNGNDHMNFVEDRKQSNCQKKRSYWITEDNMHTFKDKPKEENDTGLLK